MKLLVGLGNPGEKYVRNRHNVGFMAIERIAERHGFPAWRKRFSGLATEGDLGGERCLLLKPHTYMNESGRSVGEAVRFLKLGVGDVIILHDEIDLAPGKIKVKTGGGNAGNNGLRSISAHIENEYVRVRIGIGHPGAREAVQYYVLHDFAKVEQVWLELLLDAIVEAAPTLAKGDGPRFMSEVARRMQQHEEPQASIVPKSGKVPKPGKAPKLGEPPKETKAGAAEADDAAQALTGTNTGTKPASPAASGGPFAAKLKAWLTGHKN